MTDIRVLYVDDDVRSLQIRAEILETDHGLEVYIASDVEEGTEYLDEYDIDCVLSDLKMPGKDGFDFLEIVRDRDPDLPFILFTAHESEEYARKALEAGATDYVPKSLVNISYELLAHRIEEAVKQHRRDDGRDTAAGTTSEEANTSDSKDPSAIPADQFDWLESSFVWLGPGEETNGADEPAPIPSEAGESAEPAASPPANGDDDLLTLVRRAFETPDETVADTASPPISEETGATTPESGAPESGAIEPESGDPEGIETGESDDGGLAAVLEAALSGESADAEPSKSAESGPDDRIEHGGVSAVTAAIEDRKTDTRDGGAEQRTGTDIDAEDQTVLESGVETEANLDPLFDPEPERPTEREDTDATQDEELLGVIEHALGDAPSTEPERSTGSESDDKGTTVTVKGTANEADRTAEERTTDGDPLDTVNDDDLVEATAALTGHPDVSESETKPEALAELSREELIELLRRLLAEGPGQSKELAEVVEAETEPDESTATDETAIDAGTEGSTGDTAASTGDDRTARDDRAAVDSHSEPAQQRESGTATSEVPAESSWETNEAYERPPEVEMTPGTSVLVQCGSQDERKHATCVDLLGVNDVMDRNVVLVRYRSMDQRRLEEIATSAARVKVIAIGYTQSVPESVRDIVEVVRITNPNDVTRLGILVTGTVEQWESLAGETVVCCDPLTVLLQYKSVESAFRFLHILLGKLRSANAISHWHVDSSGSNPQQINTLKPLFDHVMTIDSLGVHMDS